MLTLYISGDRLLPAQVSKHRLSQAEVYGRDEWTGSMSLCQSNQFDPGLNEYVFSFAAVEIVSMISLTEYIQKQKRKYQQ